MTSEIKKLLQIIEDQIDWGDPSSWQSKDFENLNQLIFEKTKVSLSASTLRRVWGRVEYKHLPSGTTLDTLSRFAGFENWRTFVKQNFSTDEANKTTKQAAVKWRSSLKGYLKIAAIILAVAIAGLLTVYFVKRYKRNINPQEYTFSSQKLAKGIPNSVVFNYDATASPTDSIYIQQSWDPRTKTLVRKDMHQHTSVYYEPGFYGAKLVVGGKIVKQHKLMIPTTGWLGLIENKPVPFYLKTADFVFKTEIGYKIDTASIKNGSIQPHVPVVKYYNVGNFNPVPISGFSYSVQVKNEYGDGSAACQFASVSLITDSGPIIIPLSVKGCVSELNLLSVDWIISGKTADLSGFGVDFSNWALVSCKNTGNKIQYFINNKLAYEAPVPTYKVKIVGVGFSFHGTGSVKNIELSSNNKIVFKAF